VTLRLAMWSGPRNISTAMMRAWENRPDTIVVDEPFYACYLAATGIEHPMGEAVMASQSTDSADVAARLSSDPVAAAIFYQKHMTHHIQPGVDLRWTAKLQHCFLVRNPFEVVNSYRQKRGGVTLDDIGIVRQLSLYEEICAISGQSIPVIDARDVLIDPRRVLGDLCQRLGIMFYPEMLAWPPGRRVSDGVWAPHWYGAVEQSTGFVPYQPREMKLSVEEARVAEASMEAYERLLTLGHEAI